MPKPFSNNATPKYLGYVYQVLIAIEQCFQAKNNETIWIECFGDIYDGNTSTEVKHHVGETNLTSNSVDFWKTLKNLVTEDVSEINAFILHTTENILGDSIFFGWNELSKTEKYDKLTTHTPEKTIKPNYNVVIKTPKEKLLPILEKLTIKSSQLKVKDKWNELKGAQIFTLIDEKYKDDAFHWVYGYIHKKVIDDRKYWHIKINDFLTDFRFALTQYTCGKTPFEYVAESEVDSDLEDFLFIREMEKIQLKEKSIQKATFNYLRARKTTLKFLKAKPDSMSGILDRYDDYVLENITTLKDGYSEYIDEQELNTNKTLEKSKELYIECMKLQLISIPSVEYTEKYYQDGRIHHNVNEGKFFWRFCEDDLR